MAEEPSKVGKGAENQSSSLDSSNNTKYNREPYDPQPLKPYQYSRDHIMMMPSNVEIRLVGGQIHYLYFAGAISLIAILNHWLTVLAVPLAYYYFQHLDL